ncbi:MAG TPA: hypothetical protein VM487_18635 [Phycisphaerae bacterium]|nr:hypothetical protein [Phycisphaerae bacterium]
MIAGHVAHLWDNSGKPWKIHSYRLQFGDAPRQSVEEVGMRLKAIFGMHNAQVEKGAG